ncbi:Ribosomal-protein-alanine N-acetyltransferase [Bacillus siamensis]|nr:Ribosomal-protein-alanine N-acetyltransferase [Bacillus siamensis]
MQSKYLLVFQDPNVTRYYGLEPFDSMEEQAEKMIGWFKDQYHDKKGIRWGIERKDANGIIGTIGFNSWVPTHKRAEVGYEIHPIGAVVFIENAASHQLLIKAGFQSEGILRGWYQNGLPHDTRVYSILNEDVDETL